MSKEIANLIVQSSMDPKKVSLTVRGALIGLVPVIIGIVKFYGVEGVDENALTQIIDGIAMVTQSFLSLISVVMMTWGMIRKMFKSIKI